VFQAAQLTFINEETLLVEYGNQLDEAIFQRVLKLDAALCASDISPYLEMLPSFRSLMIRFDVDQISQQALLDSLSDLNTARVSLHRQAWRLPVCFDGPCAQDLGEASQILGMSTRAMVASILAHPLRLYMYGFAPGFAYLGGIDSTLVIPRRENPRAPMPEGALMIAGGLAAITSVSMPTGWYVLGQLPLKMFDVARTPMVPFSIGDELHLHEVGYSEFVALQAGALSAVVEAVKIE